MELPESEFILIQDLKILANGSCKVKLVPVSPKTKVLLARQTVFMGPFFESKKKDWPIQSFFVYKNIFIKYHIFYVEAYLVKLKKCKGA